MGRLSYELILLNEVVTCLDYNVVFVAEDGGDFVCDPLLHQVNVDLFKVDFLIELRWKLSRPEALLIDTERHSVGSTGVLGHVSGPVRRVDVTEVKWTCLRLGAAAGGSAGRRIATRIRHSSGTRTLNRIQTIRAHRRDFAQSNVLEHGCLCD
jgi:hypothetical protein